MALAVEIVADNNSDWLRRTTIQFLSSKVDASGAVLVAEVSLDFPESSRGSHATFRELENFLQSHATSQ
jgi:hypothetical protein